MPKRERNEALKGEAFAKAFIKTVWLLVVFPFTLYMFLIFFFQGHANIEWYDKQYYLQQEVSLFFESEYNLFFKIDEKKELVLSQVYGYEKVDDYVYFAAVGGYGIVDVTNNTADIILQSDAIIKIESSSIRYYDNLSYLDEAVQEKLVTLPHMLIAYFWDKDRAKTVGDGRFQFMRFYNEDDSSSYFLEAYGPYVNSWHDTLLPSLNGYRVEKKSQIMYATSPHGYAIVDGLAGTCRVYFTDPALAEKDYQKDIYVLDSFEDFTPEEQEILRKVEQEGLK